MSIENAHASNKQSLQRNVNSIWSLEGSGKEEENWKKNRKINDVRKCIYK